MKLVRFDAHGSATPGMIDAQGAVRDLSAVVPDIDARTLSPAALARLRVAEAAIHSDFGCGATGIQEELLGPLETQTVHKAQECSGRSRATRNREADGKNGFRADSSFLRRNR